MVVVDMRDISFKGNTLDVGNDNHGIIYNILKNEEDEVSVDYYVENFNGGDDSKYDNGVLFFSLSQLNSRGEMEGIIKEIWRNLRMGGTIHIWDMEKSQKQIIDETIKVIMPGGKEKEFQFKNFNPFSEFKLYNFQKKLEKYFQIQEGKICDRIIYIKAVKRGSVSDEDTTNSGEFKVYPQQFGGKILKSIYKGLKLQRRN